VFPGSARASRSRTFWLSLYLSWRERISARAPKCAREARALPGKSVHEHNAGLSILFDRRGDTDLSWRVELPGRFALSLGDVTRF
jgi:hypothetical protein